jgi:lipid-binding SYLF domain-containing protein
MRCSAARSNWGANASAAAGPKGRTVEASTGASLRAEILSYSRSGGLFAGVSLEGTSLRPDASGHHFVDVLEKNAPHNESKKTASR